MTELYNDNLPSNNPSSRKKIYIGVAIAFVIVAVIIVVAVVLTREKKCDDGQELVGTKCLIKCADGEVRNGEVCECKPDYEKIGTKCLVKCDGTQDRIGEKCLVKCADGVVRNGEICECKDKYNIFQYDGKDVICPPNYNFGTLEQRHGKGKSHNLWGADDVCWMTEDTADCFDGTCDPSKYLINGKPFVRMGGTNPKGKGLMNSTFSGNYVMYTYPDKTNGVYMTSAMPFTDEMCHK
jgi:hypothetical protein